MRKMLPRLCFVAILLASLVTDLVNSSPEAATSHEQLMPFLESCCLVGGSRAKSLPQMSCSRVGKSLDGLLMGSEATSKPQCEMAFKMCCSRQLKATQCEAGKAAALESSECSELSSDAASQCCQACSMGSAAAAGGGECAMDGFGFGQPFDGAYHDCCKKEETKRQEQTSAERGSKRKKKKQRKRPEDRCSSANVCEQKCVDPGDSGPLACDCFPGYNLAADGRRCEDIDECSNSTICLDNDRCVNFVGGFECVSPEDEDGSSGGVEVVDGSKEAIASLEARPPYDPRPPKRSRSREQGHGTRDGTNRSVRPNEANDEVAGSGMASSEVASTPVVLATEPRNSDGSCPPGYKPDPANAQLCVDYDECTANDHICVVPLEECSNLPGRYTCVPAADEPEVRTSLPIVAPPTSRPEPRSQQPARESPRQAARQQPGHAESCATGLRKASDGRCKDINECNIGSHHCDPRSERCENTIGSFSCIPNVLRPSATIVPRTEDQECPRGFRVSGRACEDINECEEWRPCMRDQTCINSPGGYECHCLLGYELDKATQQCRDINECALNPDACLSGFRCDNMIGSFTCVRERTCGTGYTYNVDTGHCEDDDECALNRHNCRQGYVCRNVEGSFRCDRPSCPSGQRLVRNGSCVEDCRPGHELNYWRETCDDTDECARPGACRDREVCLNTPGSYQCRPMVQCDVGLQMDDKGTSCVDIDECATGRHGCAYDQTCRNTHGAYACDCPRGFTLNMYRACEDLDECVHYGSNVCPSSNSFCVNSVGSYSCYCKEGFRTDPRDGSCVDTDECVDRPNLCGHGSTCLNTYGAFKCTCEQGFELASDGRTCIDIDECDSRRTRNATNRMCQGLCTNTEGSFRCDCPPGYRTTQEGDNCLDIDECESPGQSCANVDDICMNTRGGHKCYSITCPDGYQRDFSRRNRCVRPRTLMACAPQTPDEECAKMLKAPLSYSYNYLTFPSNLPMPPSGHLDLFTMRGPSINKAKIEFELKVVSATSDRLWRQQWATKDFFHLRSSAHNEAMLSAVKTIEGPQDIQLELSVLIYTNGQFGGTSKALIFVHVSENEF